MYAIDPELGSVMLQGKFRISALVQVALWSLYISLMVPLLILITHDVTGYSPLIWGFSSFFSGAVLLKAALSETVILAENGIAIRYPRWILSAFRKNWQIKWQDIVDLKVRSTGQGGLVYYLMTKSGQAYLLPTRIAGFNRMVQMIQHKTGIDTSSVKPLAQPWMYAMVLMVAVLMGLFDVWFCWTIFSTPI